VQYIVSSRGRPIGTTDLGFVRVDPRSRFGWFHPNAEGERLMPVIAAVLPALRAYVRNREGGDDVPAASPVPGALADVSEALQHLESLDLTLHHEDGTLIPTEMMSIQDTEQLLELAREVEGREEIPVHEPFDDSGSEAFEQDREPGTPQAELDAALAHDLALIEAADWEPDGEPSVFPRYQIFVVPVSADAIP